MQSVKLRDFSKDGPNRAGSRNKYHLQSGSQNALVLQEMSLEKEKKESTLEAIVKISSKQQEKESVRALVWTPGQPLSRVTFCHHHRDLAD